jgi:hypothetical protein
MVHGQTALSLLLLLLVVAVLLPDSVTSESFTERRCDPRVNTSSCSLVRGERSFFCLKEGTLKDASRRCNAVPFSCIECGRQCVVVRSRRSPSNFSPNPPPPSPPSPSPSPPLMPPPTSGGFDMCDPKGNPCPRGRSFYFCRSAGSIANATTGCSVMAFGPLDCGDQCIIYKE